MTTLKYYLLGLFCCYALPFWGQKISPKTQAMIDAALAKGYSHVVQGDTGAVYNQKVRIWYEYLPPKQQPTKGTILFVMGLGADGLVWSNPFLEPFLAAGYAVIRFDNRCTGASSFVKNKGANAFTLTDMANDAFSVLDKLQLKKVHLVGLSMGGMIAQQMCIMQPTRFQTLTSIISSGDIQDKSIESPAFRMKFHLAWNILRYKKGDKLHKAIRSSIYISRKLDAKKADSLDITWITQRCAYNYYHHRQTHRFASLEQQKAIYASGSRYAALQKLQIPTLIIHGTADQLVPFPHGQKCAATIPNAKTLYLKNMGHVLSMVFRGEIVKGILAHIQ